MVSESGYCRVCVFCFNDSGWKGTFGLIQYTQLTSERSQMRDPDTQEVIPERTVNVVDWIKTTVRFTCPEEGD